MKWLQQLPLVPHVNLSTQIITIIIITTIINPQRNDREKEMTTFAFI